MVGAWLLAEAGLDVPLGPLTVAPVHPGERLDPRARRRGLAAQRHGHARAVGRAAPSTSWSCDAGEPMVALVAGGRRQVEPDVNLALEPRDTLTLDGRARRGRRARAAACRGRAVRRYGALVRSAQMAGGLEYLLAQTVQYVSERKQFGRPHRELPGHPAQPGAARRSHRRGRASPRRTRSAPPIGATRPSRSPCAKVRDGRGGGPRRGHRAPVPRRHRLHLRALAALRHAAALVVARRVRRREPLGGRAGPPRRRARSGRALARPHRAVAESGEARLLDGELRDRGRGHDGGARGAPLRRGRARALPARARRGVSRARSRCGSSMGGQSNPTYHLAPPAPRVRAAPQAAGQAPAFRARGGPRVPRHHRARPAPTCRCRGPTCFARTTRSIGTAFYVMECVHGRLLADPRCPTSRPPSAPRIYDEMNAVLARAAHGGPGGARASPTTAGRATTSRRQIHRWTQQYRASETEQIDSMERLIDWLPAHMPADDTTTLVHGDFRLGNIIVAPDRAAHRGGARLGAVHARPSAGRPRLPLHAVSPRRRDAGRLPRRRSRRPRHPHRASTSRPTAAAPVARRSRTGSSTSRSRCSASPPSPRASWAASSPAPPAIPAPATAGSAPARSPMRAGGSSSRAPPSRRDQVVFPSRLRLSGDSAWDHPSQCGPCNSSQRRWSSMYLWDQLAISATRRPSI